MPKQVTFLRDCTVRLVLGDTGKVPMATIDYKAGYSGLIPDHHYEAARKAGAFDGDDRTDEVAAKTGGDAGSGSQGSEAGAGKRSAGNHGHAEAPRVGGQRSTS